MYHIPCSVRSIIPVRPTNVFPGFLEGTFFYTFCEMANLRALLADSKLDAAFDSLRKLVGKYLGDDLRGTLNDLQPGTRLSTSRKGQGIELEGQRVEELPRNIYHGLVARLNTDAGAILYSDYTEPFRDKDTFVVNPSAEVGTHFKQGGVSFSRSTHSTGNSMVLCITEENGKPRAAQIESVFRATYPTKDGRTESDVFTAVRTFTKIEQALSEKADLYKRYNGLAAELYYDKLCEDLHVVRNSQIRCHIATCPFQYYPNDATPYRVVMSLDRVRNTSLSLTWYPNHQPGWP